jgi:multidrug efflux pump subunit AcrA (membrane-fusion protein)
MRVLLVSLILLVGVGLMRFLMSMREAPRQTDHGEPSKPVQAMAPVREDVQVVIAGYGQASALDVVRISAEVSGQIVAVHPRLETGEIIPQGELLFRIDPRDYTAAVEQAEAQLSQMSDTAARLKRQSAIDQERLETLARSRELAQQELDRIRQLFEKDEVGTLSGVDKAEMAFNQSDDAYDQLAQMVELYPLRIREAEAGIESAQAQLDLGRARLTRTEITAPFTGRLKEVNLELGQSVAPGTPLVTLANDSLLEIRVPLDSRDARRWLRFTEAPAEGDTAWFGKPEPVVCGVRWSEDPGDHEWQGVLDRVVSFDEATRTMTVAVRLSGEQARSTGDVMLPLVDGMFCNVAIPGQTMTGVFRLPRWAVTFEEEVYLAQEGVDMIAIDAPRGSEEREDVAQLIETAREEASAAETVETDSADQGSNEKENLLWQTFEDVAKNYVTVAEASGGRPQTVQWVPRAELESSLAAEAYSAQTKEMTGIIENDQGFYLLRPRHRLEVRKVEVLRTQGEETFVREGLNEGDVVIVTRLVDPLPGALLDVTLVDQVESR